MNCSMYRVLQQGSPEKKKGLRQPAAGVNRRCHVRGLRPSAEYCGAHAAILLDDRLASNEVRPLAGSGGAAGFFGNYQIFTIILSRAICYQYCNGPEEFL